MAVRALSPIESVQARIVSLRGRRVIIDSDLAEMYGVPTKRLNEQVKRNPGRFPEDFAFRLTKLEAITLRDSRSQIATLKRGQNIKHLPFAFTEHGAIQAANVLNSRVATWMGVQVVRAFVRMRSALLNRGAFQSKLALLEKRVGEHDRQIVSIINALRSYAPPKESEERKIGFHRGNR